MRSTTRRDAIKQLGSAGAGFVLAGGVIRGRYADIVIAGQPVEIAVSSVSPDTVRITVRQIQSEGLAPIAATGALVQDEFGKPLAQSRTEESFPRVRAGNLVVRYTRQSGSPPTIHVETPGGQPVQRFTLDAVAPGLSFLMGSGPLLGLGEGGARFDRRGSTDRMRNGQVTSEPDGYRLAIHGTRAPIQWLVSTDPGWGLFIHQPYGAFDFTGTDGTFTPPAANALPLDLFVVGARDPKVILREYARITGLPEMPARWTFGYLQSSRTLAGEAEILAIAKTFREKKLPCDGLIYLGTEFAPSGWNTRNGEFTLASDEFSGSQESDRRAARRSLQGHRSRRHRRAAAARPRERSVHGRAAPERADGRHGWPPERQVACYWPVHKSALDVGVDGWWPDQGDGFDGPSRFNRHRMYWEGSQMYRPDERPFALHRNASAGVQRFGGFIWSGDVQNRWETLKVHVGIGINTGLSGLPYWGTDIGGFNPTPEYTGELHVRWFQFGAFNPLFRAHGRNWHLKLPWGWNGGEGGPFEAGTWRAAPEELRNANVEPICKEYLELRSRLMPYLYTAVRECHDTGMPIIRALWLHAPNDPIAAGRSDCYMWGPDLLVAPVVEQGATSKKVYLPAGLWYDFWTNEKVQGGREIDRAVDLKTTPLYVRAGTVLPLGPVKQYADEPSDAPLELVVYPGASRVSSIYEDDGKSFAYRTGAWMRTELEWRDGQRQLEVRLGTGSRMLPPASRRLAVHLAGSSEVRSVTFTGRTLDVRL